VVTRCVVLACFCSAAALMATGQEPSSTPSSQIFGTGTTAVVVDVVVRDRKGNPVTDLRKDDFELFERGVRQDIADLTTAGVPRTRSSPISGPETARGRTLLESSGVTADPVEPVRAPAFVALVFDRLSAEARALAYKGALAYVEALTDDDYAAVFLSDLALTTVQGYTNDRTTLRRAVEDVASRATSVFDRFAPDAPTGSLPIVAGAEHAGRGDLVDAGATEVHRATRNSWDVLSHAQQGYATTNALMAVTSGLAVLPGRKTMIFFAEGLSIPDAVLARFRDVVATANRANVAIYTVDAFGLRVHSRDAETGREVRAMGNAGITVLRDGSSESNLATLERNEAVLRRDPRTSLTLLAGPTGGFLIENSNDLSRRLRDIDADRRFHYLLTYTPKDATLDGTFREIAVRVPSRKVLVRARSGYLAVPGPGPMPVFVHEGPALAALERAPRPSDIAVRAGSFVFPGEREARVAVVAMTRAAGLTFTSDKGLGTENAELTVLARIRDRTGRVVWQASQPYRVGGPSADLERMRQGDLLFARHPSLPPGQYDLQVAVHDSIGGRAGVETTSFEVEAWEADTLTVSSLVVIRRGERVRDDQEVDNPLRIGDVVVHPALGDPASRSATAVNLYVEVKPGAGPPPEAALAIVREGSTLATMPVALDAPASAGRIQQLLQLPITNMPVGEYVIRLTVRQGARLVVRDAGLGVAE
jgi:VWFA-related protein